MADDISPSKIPALPGGMLCLISAKDEQGQIRRTIQERPLADLPPGDVTIRVRYSSLNYKDALAASGHPGVAKKLPHVPGIDAAGVVVASSAPQHRVGDEVLVTGYDLGAGRWGGYSQLIRVPGEWPIALPPGLTLRQSMLLGTAGFTAAQCVAALEKHGVRPPADVIVTGASGGVGSVAVGLLARLGYAVHAVSGKPAAHALLRDLGASEVLSREDVDDSSAKPLLSARWSGAVDTVGGNTLATVLRSLRLNGCAAACGLVGGADLALTVHPFLLRAVTLVGIDSAWRTHDERIVLWNRLALSKLDWLEPLAHDVPLAELEPWIERILAGGVTGRVVVHLPD